MAVLQMIKPISDSGGVPTFLLPIGVVIFVTMVKDAYEDVKRHQFDKLENTRVAHVLDESGLFRDVEWRALKPGDVVYVKANEQIPADLVLLTCSDPYGLCYLETEQLDGETNLKGKTCLTEFQEMFPTASSIASAHLEIIYGGPDAQLYSFKGTLRLYSEAFHCDDDAEARETLHFLQRRVSNDSQTLKDPDLHLYSHLPYVDFPTSITQFLWRGTTLTNTEWAIGLAVYTGRHTRIFRNTKSRRLKYSQLLKTYNKHALVLAGTQFLLCFIAATLYAIGAHDIHTRWYLTSIMPPAVSAKGYNPITAEDLTAAAPGLLGFLSSLGIGFGRYTLLLSYFVPITLFVQLEIVKWFQAYFFTQDKEMHMTPSPSDTEKPTTSVQTVSLMEELGNVTHVFTDKTGTLTLNLMQLKCLGIGNTLFGFGDAADPTYDSSLDNLPRDSDNQKNCSDTHQPPSKDYNNPRHIDSSNLLSQPSSLTPWSIEEQAAIRTLRRTPNPYVDFDTWLLLKYIDRASDVERAHLRQYLLILSLCHSVLPKQQTAFEEYNTSLSDEVQLGETELAGTARKSDKPLGKLSRVRCVKYDPTNVPQYDASSPDERALVCGALHIGIEFLQRPTLNSIQIGFTNRVIRDLMLTADDLAIVEKVLSNHDTLSLTEKYPLEPNFSDWPTFVASSCSSTFHTITPSVIYDVLEVLEFDNIRKKMSVVVRDSGGVLQLLTKGADTTMIASAAPNQTDYIKTALADQLADLSREGFRTLVLGFRLLDITELTEFRRNLAAARLSSDPDALVDLYNSLERNLTLLGCTGVDDRLQPAVPQVIEDLHYAGIKVWVLTGDKLETAVSIGRSCHVLKDTTYNAIINGQSESEVIKQLQQYMNFIVAGQLASAAFDQISSQSRQKFVITKSLDTSEAGAHQSRDDDDGTTHQRPGSCVGRVVTSLKALSCTRTASVHQSITRRRKRGQRALPTMRWEDFVKTLNFQAKHTPVVSQPQQSTPSPLTPEQVNAVIQEYLRSFHPAPVSAKQSPSGSHPFVSQQTLETTSSKNETALQQLPYSPAEDVHDLEVQRYTQVAITCTGDALGFILNNDVIKRYFFGLANLCTTVIACRVTPKQKAEVVRQAASYLPGTVSLAIGDGANDVGMIITANVGVGITGKEGMQAARAADFSIGEFRALRHILFHHGHENLRRNSFQVYHTVYKNVLFGLADWTFGYFSMFTATDLYSTWLKQILNLFFTPFPSLILSIFDRRLPVDIFLSCPWLYPTAQDPKNGREAYFGNRRFAAWLGYGFYSALLVTLVPSWIILHRSMLSMGYPVDDVAVLGHLIFWLVVVVSNVTPIPFFHTWYWFAAIGYSLCFTVWFISWAVCSSGVALCEDLSFSLQMLDSSAVFHLSFLLTVTIVLLPLFFWWFAKNILDPDPALIIRERIALGVFDVVVAPKHLGALGVVVPRQEGKEQWHGFAFSEDVTRFQFHRRVSILPQTVITRTAALRTAAGGIIQGKTYNTANETVAAPYPSHPRSS